MKNLAKMHTSCVLEHKTCLGERRGWWYKDHRRVHLVKCEVMKSKQNFFHQSQRFLVFVCHFSTKQTVFECWHPWGASFTIYYQDYNMFNQYSDGPFQRSSLVLFHDLVNGFWHIHPNIQLIDILLLDLAYILS